MRCGGVRFKLPDSWRTVTNEHPATKLVLMSKGMSVRSLPITVKGEYDLIQVRRTFHHGALVSSTCVTEMAELLTKYYQDMYHNSYAEFKEEFEGQYVSMLNSAGSMTQYRTGVAQYRLVDDYIPVSSVLMDSTFP